MHDTVKNNDNNNHGTIYTDWPTPKFSKACTIGVWQGIDIHIISIYLNKYNRSKTQVFIIQIVVRYGFEPATASLVASFTNSLVIQSWVTSSWVQWQGSTITMRLITWNTLQFTCMTATNTATSLFWTVRASKIYLNIIIWCWNTIRACVFLRPNLSRTLPFSQRFPSSYLRATHLYDERRSYSV